MTPPSSVTEPSQTWPGSIGVVGASHAAVALADRLRAASYDGSIMLISQENHVPYQRPPLSKAWLKGEAGAASLLLREPSYYAEQSIELLTGVTVTGLHRHDDGSTGVDMTSDDGQRGNRRFDRLVIATGARARTLDLPGADHRDVLVLRELDDARALAGRVGAGPVVVIGGGFVGLEVAATASALGARVTVVEAGERLLGRAVGPHTAAQLLDAHRASSTEVVLGVLPERIVHDDNGIQCVVLADGREIPASTVLMGVGAEPRTELAARFGLDCDCGVLVDQHCLTSDGVTLAIGDCTAHQAANGARYRLESVDNATEQANAAAATLLGHALPPRPAPWFWSDQGEQKLQIAGLIGGHTSVLLRGDSKRPNRRIALYFRHDELIAAECLNAPADFVAIRSALSRGYRPGPEIFADESLSIKKLLMAVRA